MLAPYNSGHPERIVVTKLCKSLSGVLNVCWNFHGVLRKRERASGASKSVIIRAQTTAIFYRDRMLPKRYKNICCNQAFTQTISSWDQLTRKVPTFAHPKIVGE